MAPEARPADCFFLEAIFTAWPRRVAQMARASLSSWHLLSAGDGASGRFMLFRVNRTRDFLTAACFQTVQEISMAPPITMAQMTWARFTNYFALQANGRKRCFTVSKAGAMSRVRSVPWLAMRLAICMAQPARAARVGSEQSSS